MRGVFLLFICSIVPSTWATSQTVVSAPTWINILDKQALVCQLDTLAPCLAHLPVDFAQLNALHPDKISQSIGMKSAMVLSINHGLIAGIIVVQPHKEIQIQTGSLGLKTYSIPLKNQSQLSLWHEVGHLYNIALQGEILPASLSSYQHEWLADIYLFWQLAQVEQLEYAWQQLHRRNLAVIHNSDNLSHWSSPQLSKVLHSDETIRYASEHSYKDFIAYIYPQLPNYSARDLAEYSSLIQRTFGAGVVQPLPNYIFWRQPSLSNVIAPTLHKLMGAKAAQVWLSQHLGAGTT
ncbi:hypothetical protein [Shewanella gaetbuli]|uniref:Uncharacterized protein n=1 Tax=Shewanella gaetbuli TaxID=220752 RepID=A0A9X2CF79_9GAMM|nr:hypothetical protein [Shewanella gaetbuli]MCL1141138.1 hypothetical protein [Shewanella gaetbuli]